MQNSPAHLIANGMRQDASYKLFNTITDLTFSLSSKFARILCRKKSKV
jgi:hypothetical protein